MRSILYIGDQNPPLSTQLLYADGTAVNGTGHSQPTFSLRYSYGTANIFTGTAAWATGTAPAPSQAAGYVTYTFGTADLSGLVPGIADGQWKDVDATGKPMHMDAGAFELRAGF
jgi:hypothetical protein